MGRKRRMYLRGNLDHKLTLATLENNTAIKTNVADTVIDKTWISSVDATWSIGDLTGGTGDGPVLVGFAHSDYSVQEIEEFLENLKSWDYGQLLEQEHARRFVRVVGTVHMPPNTEKQDIVMNDGLPIKTKANFYLSPGDTISIWAYNQGSAQLVTGAILQVNGHANLWPR